MKIKKLMKQTKEYERLERIIKGIEKALEDFERIRKEEVRGGAVTLQGGWFDTALVSIGDREEAEVSIDVFLNSEISALIRSDVKDLLLGHLGILKKQQNDLEI